MNGLQKMEGRKSALELAQVSAKAELARAENGYRVNDDASRIRLADAKSRVKYNDAQIAKCDASILNWYKQQEDKGVQIDASRIDFLKIRLEEKRAELLLLSASIEDYERRILACESQPVE